MADVSDVADRAVIGQAMALLDAAAKVIREAVMLNTHPTEPLRPPLTDTEQVYPPFILSRAEVYQLSNAAERCRVVALRMKAALSDAQPAPDDRPIGPVSDVPSC